MLKNALIVCGATLLLAGSSLAGTSDDAMPGDGTHMQQPLDEAGSGRQPGDTLGEERGTGDAGTLGSGATGEDVLDADKPAEQFHKGEQYDAEGNPTGHTPSGMIRP